MWSTFVPYIPNSILPGAIAFVIAMAAVIMVSFTLPMGCLSAFIHVWLIRCESYVHQESNST